MCEMKLSHPLNADIKRYYENFGLNYVTEGGYLYVGLQDKNMHDKIKQQCSKKAWVNAIQKAMQEVSKNRR